jgi:hypothetical protein
LGARATRGNGLTLEPGASGAVIGNLQKEMHYLQDRFISICVPIGDLIFPTLEYTTKWTALDSPQDPEDAFICVNALFLFHSIGTEFSTTSDTRNYIYHNKKDGVNLVFCFVFEFSHLIASHVCPCATTYSEWYINNDGIVSGVKPLIEEGIKNQINFYQGEIEEVNYTHPAAVATTMLAISVKFCDVMIVLINKMTTEHASHRGEVKPEKSWLQICAISRQVFRELSKVQQ